MYLSRLEMVGFKSFGLKTDLTFNDGVTGIVGPNGCGKTNIVDAIRWVLGEQKTSMLRADSMEHVIFNGSKNRKPLGMAEVSLTIENNKQILPTEYSQVVITRRLFRSGESQYLLNRTPCRLKDIVELFMDTGMGANAYSVIELKMIETILSDKADERRHLFEEAAGVTKYKARRKEAQRKLEAAQKDIARVQDIVREVQKTVNSLARQAEKARQHQEISAQLRDVDQQVFFIEYAAAREHLASLTDANTAIVAEKVAAENVLAQCELAVLNAEQTHARIDQQVRDVADKEGAVKSALSETTGEVSVIKERIASAERAIERLERENTLSTDEQTTTSEQLVSVKSRLEQVKMQVVEAHANLDQCRQAAKEQDSQLSQVRSQLSSARTSVQSLQQKHHELRRDQDRQRIQGENIRRRIAESELGLREQQTRVAELTASIASQQNEVPALDQALAQSESALHAAEQRQHELRNQQEQQQHILDELRSTEAHTRASMEFLVGLVDTTESSKFLMNSDEWKPSGEKLTLAEVLNTTDELRVAVEAALGDAARFFVVANRTEANQAIGALSRNNVGKATFLCRDAIPAIPEPPAIPSIPGVRGWASEMVEADASLKGAIRGILGRTVITETLDAAWNAVHAPGVEHAVTLAGEVVHQAGAVRGGSTGRTEGVRIGRRERIENMRSELASLEEQIQQGLAQAQKLKDEYAAIDLRALAEVVRQATVSRNAVLQKLDSLNNRMAEVTKVAEKLQDDVTTFAAELAGIGESHQQMESEVARVQSELDQAQEAVSMCEGLEAAAVAEYARVQATVREAEILAVRLDGELTSLQSDETRLSDQRLTIDQRREQRAQEVVQLTASLTEFAKLLTQTTERADELARQLTEVTSQRQSLELSLQEESAALHSHTEQVRVARKNLEAVVERHHALDLDRTGSELKLDTLRRHAVEELDITGDLDELAEQRRRHVQAQEQEQAQEHAPADGAEVSDDAEGTESAHDTVSSAPQEVPIDQLRVQSQELRRKLTQMGNVNFLALEEHERENERLQFMSTQLADLLESEKTLSQTILEINQAARDLFTNTFNQIRENFTRLFKVLFSEDDEADLQMLETEDNDPLECKVEIIAKPRGKRPHSIEMLSGGEKTLTAIALLFAIYLVKPSPFCILDEVDAPLDDANIDRYLKIIRKFSADTQFLMITHNKRTMEAADTLYGVTMEEPAVSKVVSVQLGSGRTAEASVA